MRKFGHDAEDFYFRHLTVVLGAQFIVIQTSKYEGDLGGQLDSVGIDFIIQPKNDRQRLIVVDYTLNLDKKLKQFTGLNDKARRLLKVFPSATNIEKYVVFSHCEDESIPDGLPSHFIPDDEFARGLLMKKTG